MGNLLETHDSLAQKIWVTLIRLIGGILFISVLFLPIRAYFYESIPNVKIQGNDWLVLSFGLSLSAGGKYIGIILNNIGIGIGNLIQKFTK